MSEKLREHPIIVYVAFVLPALLFVCGLLLGAGAPVFIALMVWIGISLMILFLPVSNESGAS